MAKYSIFDNGELGFVRLHGFDKGKMDSAYFRLERFQVNFARKENLCVNYGSGVGKKPNGRWIPAQPVEDIGVRP